MPHTPQLKDINSPRRHEVHEEKPKKNLRVLRVFVVKCLKLMSIDFQINNFYVDRYHPFKGCYLYKLTATRIGNLISESL